MNKAQVRSLARKLGTEANDALFRLADILSMVHLNGYYHDWGWRAWYDYVESEVGISTAASYELMQIARWANRYALTKAQRNKLAPLGRCKVAALTKLARKDNVDEWLEYATTNTVRKLKRMAKGIHDDNAPQNIAVWMHAHHRREYRDAMNVARDKLGDVIQGELLGDICSFYLKHKKLRTRK